MAAPVMRTLDGLPKGESVRPHWTAIIAISAVVAAALAAYALWQTASINELQIRASAPFFSLKSMAIKNAKPTLFPNQEVTDISVYVQMQIENGGQRPAHALTILLIRTTIPPSREPKRLHQTVVANPIFPNDTPIYSLFIMRV
ncbi:MAG: hypothetical protein O7D34_05720 [Ignavibacteria bacterium]|nr:hypothetical protein [Ignavibacteria bacterium]